MDTGTVVAGRYELVALLGRGGMGEVWEGFDQHLDRRVAIKFIRGEVLADEDRRTEARERLRREARVTARIQHPGVPIIHDVGDHGHELFLVMQLVAGLTVDDLIAEQGRLPVSWAAAIAAQLCAVLTVAHAESLIHRDLKPANLMLCPDGTLKVLDFGIVAVLDPSFEVTKLTRANEVPGTPAYMAREYALTGAATPQSDLYAVGCIMHEMLTGGPVFTAAHTIAVQALHYQEPPPRLRTLNPDVPENIECLVLELLAKLPEDRPAAAAAVYERLLPYVVALPPLPGATAVSPNPDPMRMYATVVGRIADTALVGPRVPGPPVREPGPPRPSRLNDNDVMLVRQQASAMVDAGRYTQAIELMRATVPQATEELGERNQLVLALRFDLATAMFIDRDYEHARPEFADLAAKLAEQWTPEHDLVLECRLSEAGCLAGLGRTREALAQLQDLLPAFEQVYGATGSETLKLRDQIGRLLVATGQYELAWPLLGDLLIDLRNIHGDEYPETENVRELVARLDQLGH